MSSVQLRQRIHVMQQRTGAPLAHAHSLLLERCLEIHDEAPFVERGAVLGQQDGSAAGGEHDGAFARDVFDDFPLALPEASLAFARKDVRDVDAGTRSISASLSRKGARSRRARCLPTAVFPEPIGPIKKTFVLRVDMPKRA